MSERYYPLKRPPEPPLCAGCKNPLPEGVLFFCPKCEAVFRQKYDALQRVSLETQAVVADIKAHLFDEKIEPLPEEP